MKLLQVTSHYLPVQGGQEVYIQSMNKLLNDFGISTDVVQPFSRHVRTRPANVYMLPRLPYLHHVIHDINWFWFNAMLSFFRNRIKCYDVVISHYAFHAEMLREARKLIVLSHGVDWQRPAKTMADRYRALMASKTAAAGSIIVANDTDYLRMIGCPVEPAEKYFEEVAPGRWFIPNCVDVDKYQPGLDQNRERIILVPRNIRWARGIHLAIEAFQDFSRNYQNFKLVIAGGPLTGRYFRYCSELIKKLDLEDRIVWEGSVPQEKIIQYYQKATITLIPTLALEGTSLSALESMAAKTPVVSTNVGGLADLPTVQSDPVAAQLAGKLRYVMDNYGKVRAEQYHQTRDIFNMDNWGKAWLKVVRS
jgi:glycosyltransferase involved in cell wall biosynthesis